MIPAGRTVVDTYDIAVLHGMSAPEAATQRPWDRHGHPAPLTSGRSSVTRSPLWDEAQAIAFANLEPVPTLPDSQHPEDLLDVVDVAERLGVSVSVWMAFERYEHEHDRPKGRTPIVPAPDRVICGHRHWYRRSVDVYGAAPAPQRTYLNNSAGERNRRREVKLLVGSLLDHIGTDGERLSWAELAREIDRSYGAAFRCR